MKYLVIAFCLFLVGCKAVAEALEPTIRRLIEDGVITAEQGKLIFDALAANLPGFWDRLGELAATAVTSIVGTLGIVKKWRGPIDARKGTLN